MKIMWFWSKAQILLRFRTYRKCRRYGMNGSGGGGHDSAGSAALSWRAIAFSRTIGGACPRICASRGGVTANGASPRSAAAIPLPLLRLGGKGEEAARR